jgi:hypothetical protein
MRIYDTYTLIVADWVETYNSNKRFPLYRVQFDSLFACHVRAFPFSKFTTTTKTNTQQASQ